MEKHLLCRVFLLFVTSLVIDSAEVLNATVGDNVELQCVGPEGTVVGLKWKQENQNRTVLIYRSGRIEETQDKCFTNRVKLLDPEVKSGNLGVRLKDVTEEDSGIYKCDAHVKTSTRQKRAITDNDKEIIQYVQLHVRSGEGKEDKKHDSTAGAVVAVLVVVFVVGLVAGIVYRKRESNRGCRGNRQTHQTFFSLDP